jgi:hypothetical protein
MADEIDFTLFTPFTMCVLGPTFSGKSEFVLDLIKRRHEVTLDKLDKVVYVYSEMQPRFKDFAKENPDVTFTNQLDQVKKLAKENTLIIFDDLMMDFQSKDNDFITEFFIKGAHHRKCSVILILQVSHHDLEIPVGNF